MKRKAGRLRRAVAAAAREVVGIKPPDTNPIIIDESRFAFEQWRKYALSLEVYLGTLDTEWRGKYTAFVHAEQAKAGKR